MLAIANFNSNQALASEKAYNGILKENIKMLNDAYVHAAMRADSLESATVPEIPSNNPGNIVKGVKWKGEVTCTGRFECFKSPEHGIRAIGKLLNTYRYKHGLFTVKEIITRWAPPHENNTTEFIRFVKRAIRGDVTNTRRFVEAIITFEQGFQPYSEGTITRGLASV